MSHDRREEEILEVESEILRADREILKLVRPRLAAPKELEDSSAPQFAQLVGLLVAGAGFVLGFFGITAAIPLAAAAAFVAAFLNAAFNYCLGCQIYLGLKRAKVIR
jgi:hypothetical protein